MFQPVGVPDRLTGARWSAKLAYAPFTRPDHARRLIKASGEPLGKPWSKLTSLEGAASLAKVNTEPVDARAAGHLDGSKGALLRQPPIGRSQRRDRAIRPGSHPELGREPSGP